MTASKSKRCAMESQRLIEIVRQARTCAIFTVGGIGDHLFALPFLWSFRRYYPHLALVQVTTQPKVASLCLKAGLVDEIVDLTVPMGVGTEKRSRRRRLGPWTEFLVRTLELRLRRLDLSIFLATGLTPRLALWQWLVGARFRIATGFSTLQTRPWINYIEPEVESYHHIDRNLRLAQALGCSINDSFECYKVIFRNASDAALGKGKVFIHPFGVSPIRDGRQWPLSKFRMLYEFLKHNGVNPIVIGTQDELNCSSLKNWVDLNTVPLSSVEDAAFTIAGARLVIGNDSAVVHLASILGVLALSVVGSSDPRCTRPYFGGGVARLELPCSPCFLTAGYRKCNHFSCVERLSPELLIAHPLIKDLLSQAGGQFQCGFVRTFMEESC